MTEHQNGNTPHQGDQRKSGRRRRRGRHRGKGDGDGQGQEPGQGQGQGQAKALGQKPRHPPAARDRDRDRDDTSPSRGPAKRDDRNQSRHGHERRPDRQHAKPGSGKPGFDARTAPGSDSKQPPRPQGDKDRDKRHDRDQRKDRGARLIKELSQPTEQAIREHKLPTQTARHVLHRYGLAIYDNFAQAKADLLRLQELANQYDQLNVVIRAEGNMDDPELTALGRVKVFAGAAWTLIHERRKQDGWYDEPR